ncbi:MAG: Ig-like domain-containing protein, partial [Clostridia bacterium]|nr:Ig-like domain-containing protein [Clostridia bacterium]
MKVSLIKKSFSIILAVVMLLTMVPATVFAAEKDLPVMKAYRTVTGDYHDYKKQVVTVTFLDKIDTSGALQSWDVSENGDGSVMAWMKKNEEKSAAAGAVRYDVYIGGEGGVSANPVSSDVFFGFENLEEINGFEHFDTSKATTFAYMFQQCYSIKTLDLSSFDTSNVTNFLWLFVDCISLETVNLNGWDTSEVTTMDSMFKNCVKLNPLDISSFNTAKAKNMANMFYRCESLKTLYVGDGWILDQVTSSNAMFNCCYLIEGKKSYNDPSVSLPHDKKYATTDYFVTYKAPDALKEYTVSYEFKGDVIPEDVTLPDAFRYNEGSIIEVAGAPSAEGYAFSGWTTDDTTVEDGKFAVNNDVHFVGTWTKLYKVEYRYADGFEVPEGAPELPEAVYYKAGDDVDKLGIPYVYRHIFVGWTTDDADATSDIFTMPENDVVFYGYFKIPVESIEVIGGDITVNAGEKEKITVYVKPEDATIKDIVYESSDESIVKVDEYGNITAVGEGTATVTVASKDDPTKSDTVTVNVKIPVTELVVDKTEITLKKDGTDKINATVNGDATNKKVIFESDNENIVTVDENGNLKAVGEGTTTVTVKSEDDSSITATVTVTVKNPVTEITATEDFTLNVGDEKNLEAKVNEDATNKELIYESDNPGVVKVDSNGDVRAVGEGTATITITSKDNPSITETVTVTVKIPVSDVTVEKDEITLNKGDKDTIVPVVTPDNATNKEVTYTSSDETVVKVDENGNIEAVGKGEATITITSKDNPSEFVTVKVTVEIPVEDVVSDK